MKLKEIIKQFDVNINLTSALENLEMGDGFKTHQIEETDNGNILHVFTKKLQVNDATGKHELIINPIKMEVLNIIDSPESMKWGFELIDKDGRVVKRTFNNV